MYKRYNNDPRWIQARYNSTCSCGHEVFTGQNIYYYPKGHKALCEQCGEQAERDFMAMAQDEDMYNN